MVNGLEELVKDAGWQCLIEDAEYEFSNYAAHFHLYVTRSDNNTWLWMVISGNYTESEIVLLDGQVQGEQAEAMMWAMGMARTIFYQIGHA
jgi:hypothetical protein